MAKVAYLLSEQSLDNLSNARVDATIAQYARKGVNVLPAEARKMRERGLVVKRSKPKGKGH